MALAIVQSAFANTHFGPSVTSGTMQVTLGSAVSANNGVLLGFGANDGLASSKSVGSVVDDKANSYLTQIYDNTITEGTGWFYKVNIGNGPITFSVPWTISVAGSVNAVMAAYELSGLNSSPADVGSVLASSFATSFNLGFTTAANNEMGFALLNDVFASNQTSVTMTNGWTLETGLGSALGPPYYSCFAHVNLSASGANSIQGSTSAADAWQVTLATVLQSSGGLSPSTGGESIASSPARMNTGITPLLAKERGIYMPQRKIILPTWQRKPVMRPHV